MILPALVSPAPYLRMVWFPSTCVVLDEEKGTVRLLSEEAARAVSHLCGTKGATSDLDLSPDQERTLVGLMDAKILMRGGVVRDWDRVRRGIPSAPSWGTRVSPAALTPLPRVSLRWYALGALALSLVLSTALGRRGVAFHRTRHLVQETTSGITDHAAAVEATYAVRKMGRLIPLRVACWEEAAATAIALSWAGYRSAFRHGVATDPVRLHAWVEVGGRPVAESDDITDYTSFEESCE